MEVILLEKMRNLGALGEKVKVKSGYARNFLIPQGKAAFANAANIAKFEERRAELEKAAAERLKKATARQSALAALGDITITAKAGEEGKLFGSITSRDIADAIVKAGGEVDKREVSLSEGTLRHLGTYDVMVELDSDLTAVIKVNVIAEA